jgi:hypothetical protein
LFFLDEVTAFAAGHRPCFECRRKDAEWFAVLWRKPGQDKARARAADMDRVLHEERLEGSEKRKFRLPIDDLPDGAMIDLNGSAWAIRGNLLLQWTPWGYTERRNRLIGETVRVLTPPSTLQVLRRGYTAQWHPSACQFNDKERYDRSF